MKNCDVRGDFHVPGNVTRFYDIDQSGTILYECNSYGFRSEEYDPLAEFRICVIGESNAVGVGISLEDTFGYKLKQHMSASLRLDLDKINLINLSVAGASADYCVRTLYRQISDCDMDLVVCQLPHPGRTEYLDESGYHPCNVNAVRIAKLASAPAPLLAYCDYYNESVGMINLVKNALQAQAFLKERNIQYVLATQFLPRSTGKHSYLGDYFDRLDASAVLWHEYFIQLADQAADKRHAGRLSHAAFAIELLDFFGRMQIDRGNEDLGRRVKDYAAHLKANDKDWKSWNDFAAAANAQRKNTSI